MNIDDLDLMLIMFFLEYNGQTHTCVDVVKVLYAPENRVDMIRDVNRVNYRLEKWVKHNVFLKEIRKEGNKEIAYYTINIEGVYLGEAEINIAGKKIDAGEALVLKIKNGKYFISYILEE